MTFPASHKTVFILDHSPFFSGSCLQHYEFDSITKTRQTGVIPLATVSKSLWTSSVESAIEYCRIVWDIFPTGKLIRFLVHDTAPRFLNSWSQDEQSMSHLMAAFAECGAPVGDGKQKYSITKSLKAAIDAMIECTDAQHHYRTSLDEQNSNVLNRCRIVCICALLSEAEIRKLEETLREYIAAKNKTAMSADKYIAIDCVEVVIVHTQPFSRDTSLTMTKKEVNDNFVLELHRVACGKLLPARLGYLVQQHYNLASTTVTGIPMKEEQNANSSANYDVELLHPLEAHRDLLKSGASITGEETVQVSTVKEGQTYQTITLKWCTPRAGGVELQHCTGACRVTPVDINSRPSSCLTNFLLGGRAVMLEIPRKSGAKVMSHMLTSHGGEIYIHALGTGRSTLEDPPSISEGPGGRVTDYRITDFGNFMKDNTLVSYAIPKSIKLKPNELPIEHAKRQLDRMTQYWPMVISLTTIYNNVNQLEPLLSLITRETLTQDEVIECKKVIFHLVSMESKQVPITAPSAGQRGKGPKKEEQYRNMWNELENLVRMYCVTAEHNVVLDCLLECRRPDDIGGNIRNSTDAAEKGKDDKTAPKWGEGEQPKVREGEDAKGKGKLGEEESGVKRARFDADIGKVSLLTLWKNRMLSERKKHPEFSGRLLHANAKVVPLYTHLNLDKDSPT